MKRNDRWHRRYHGHFPPVPQKPGGAGVVQRFNCQTGRDSDHVDGSAVWGERCIAILSQFEMEYVLPGVMDWAIQSMQTNRLSQGIAVNDCFIASVCSRLNVPVYTDNEKDFLKVLPASLVSKPY